MFCFKFRNAYSSAIFNLVKIKMNNKLFYKLLHPAAVVYAQ